jgi:hypothetical protein
MTAFWRQTALRVTVEDSSCSSTALEHLGLYNIQVRILWSHRLLLLM